MIDNTSHDMESAKKLSNVLIKGIFFDPKFAKISLKVES